MAGPMVNHEEIFFSLRDSSSESLLELVCTVSLRKFVLGWFEHTGSIISCLGTTCRKSGRKPEKGYGTIRNVSIPGVAIGTIR